MSLLRLEPRKRASAAGALAEQVWLREIADIADACAAPIAQASASKPRRTSLANTPRSTSSPLLGPRRWPDLLPGATIPSA
mmetsp:Transcript_79466/g.229819  ORF Transcript_79466/g.229819 Transcript_79466/m.229819 type:complete len:81 (+) Transcript_79466:3-245(+)